MYMENLVVPIVDGGHHLDGLMMRSVLSLMSGHLQCMCVGLGLQRFSHKNTLSHNRVCAFGEANQVN